MERATVNQPQAFLLQDQWWREAMTGVRGVSRHHEEVAAFTAPIMDIWSPSISSPPTRRCSSKREDGDQPASGLPAGA
jgi:hypothetical protein